MVRKENQKIISALDSYASVKMLFIVDHFDCHIIFKRKSNVLLGLTHLVVNTRSSYVFAFH